MKFQDKLQVLRKAKGLSQEKLGYEIGVSRQAITKWENGTAMPEVEKVLALSEFFHVTTDYLLKDAIEIPEPEMQPATPKRAKLSRYIKVGAVFLAAAALAGITLLILSRSFPVYSLSGNGSTLMVFLKYHEIQYVGYMVAAIGCVGLVLILAEVVMRVRRARN